MATPPHRPFAGPHPPSNWDQTFAWLHQLWGQARIGVYDKDTWARFEEGLQARRRESRAGARRSA